MDAFVESVSQAMEADRWKMSTFSRSSWPKTINRDWLIPRATEKVCIKTGESVGS